MSQQIGQKHFFPFTQKPKDEINHLSQKSTIKHIENENSDTLKYKCQTDEKIAGYMVCNLKKKQMDKRMKKLCCWNVEIIKL